MNPQEGLDKFSQMTDLMNIPGIGIAGATDLWMLGIHSISELQGQDPEQLYLRLCEKKGPTDRCVLYTFRCAVYFASTPPEDRKSELLKWWNWTDERMPKDKRQ